MRGDEPVIRLDNALFALKAEKILPLHKLFKNFHPNSVKVIMDHSITLKVARGKVLYKQGEPAQERVYIIIVGKISLKGFLGDQEKFDNIGSVEAGDTLGEEGVFEAASIHRKETAYAEEDVYLFEIVK